MTDKKTFPITKGMHIKFSRELPVLYVPVQDRGQFVSIYCKGSEGIPLIQNEIKKTYEQQVTEEFVAEGKEVQSEQARTLIAAAAIRRTLDLWNFFWAHVYKVQENGHMPFVIKIRELNQDKLKQGKSE